MKIVVGGIGERIKINKVASKTRTQPPTAANAKIIQIELLLPNKNPLNYYLVPLDLPSIRVVSNNSQMSPWF